MRRSARAVPSGYLIPAGVAAFLLAAVFLGGRPVVDSQGRPVVVYAHPPCPPELMEIYTPIFDEFRATHPDIDFRVLHITGNYEDKIKVMFAGGVAPDVIFMYPTALPAWVELGALEPLDGYLERRPDIGRESYAAPMIETFSYNGKLYGLPKDASAYLMEYNVHMFDACGVARPRDDWTWQDMLSAARSLTRDTDGDGRVDQWGVNPFPWFDFVTQNGGRVLDGTRTECLLLEEEAIEALEFWAALRHRHGVTPTPEAAQDLGGIRLFTLGRVGMHFEMYPVVSMLRKQCDFKWDIAHVPGGPSGRASTAVGSALAITAQSRNKEAAFEWIRWMTSAAGMRSLMDVESPSCVELIRSGEFERMPGMPASKRVALDVMEYARPPFQHSLYAEIMDALGPDLDRANRGVVTVREALYAAVPAVNRILQRGASPAASSGRRRCPDRARSRPGDGGS